MWKIARIRLDTTLGPYFVIVGYYLRSSAASGTDDETGPAAVLRVERCLRVESDPPGSTDARSKLIADLRNGDIWVSPSIAHLAVSSGDLVRTAYRIHKKGATLRLSAEKIDTAIPAARNMLNAMAEFERTQLAQRREAGLREAAAMGKRAGRPRKLDDKMLRTIRDDLAAGLTYAAIARNLGVHPTTIMRLLRRTGSV